MCLCVYECTECLNWLSNFGLKIQSHRDMQHCFARPVEVLNRPVERLY